MSLSALSVWLFATGVGFVIYVQRRLARHRNRLPLPPGPRGFPVLGNVLDIPTEGMVSAFRDMNATYGDIVYLNILGQPTVILGTHSAAVDLLEKRSAIYSDRNVSTMTKLSGLDWLFGSTPYGSWWRRQRKLFHRHFNSKAILPYRPIQEQEVHRFVLRIMQEPEKFLEHIRFAVTATILRVTYGLQVSGRDDEYVVLAEATVAIQNAITVPGKYLVEVLPFLRFLPSWLPGAKFRREGKTWMPITRRMRDAPWDFTMKTIRDGSAVSSVATNLAQEMFTLEGREANEGEEISRNVAAAAYAGGADTTLSATETFFLAMAAFPESQKKAQAELDAIVGPHRLPCFSDKASLPYLTALLKECLRWKVIGPFGFPHCSTEDDEFRGHFIPKGTTVIANLWAYSRDIEYYPDPEAFKPERFLKDGKIDPDVLDPAAFVFGYGRRSCPGRHFADDALFMTAATVLHTLLISAPLDAEGHPVRLEGKMTPGLISYPEPFDVVITPRTDWAEALVRESCSMGNL
uniref:Cytochrome P450 monooxygenase n=1 Tax=Trametes versicolor TaxID=5325 RepID=A0AA86J4H1_TRAVE|nr:cytochrome P450 monooxygenase [Trametes versicolor]